LTANNKYFPFSLFFPMKHLFLFLCLLAAWPSQAQTYRCTEAVSRQQRTADSLLLALDKSQIPTHILYDRVAPLARLDGFNLNYNNPDTSSVQHYLQAYYELHQADYTNTGNEPCRQVLAENAHHYQQHDTLLLGVLRYRFNYIDSNAVRNGQLRWDTSAPSRLFDVAGRRGSPYLLREVAVAAALADSTRSGTVSFRLDPASIFSNVGAALTSASIDFGDGGGTRTLVPGQVVQVSYAAAGRKTLRYVLRYADGSQFTTYSSLYIPSTAGCANCRTAAVPKPIPACRVEKLTASIQFQGSAGRAEVSYYYSTNGTKTCDADKNLSQPITKPIVLIDGIDYGDERKGSDIFGGYLAYQDGIASRNLGRQLQDVGYDVVVLDFPNIEQNIKI
jgi:hypothetical protein